MSEGRSKLGRSTCHRQHHGPLNRESVILKCGVVRFWGLDNFIVYSGRIIPAILGKGWRFSEIGPLSTFWSALETVVVPLCVSFSLLMCYNECILRIKV